MHGFNPPFTRASSAGLTGKRVIGCLRSEATSFMTPRQAEQRSEPAGPRSRVPGGIAKGGRASGPPWLAVKAKSGLSDSTKVATEPMDPRLREDDVGIGAASQCYPSAVAGLAPLPKHQHQPQHNRPHPQQTQRRHAIAEEQEIQQRGATRHQVEQAGHVD